ncbi:hypothetical protein [Parafrankia sp. EUN1f]|uniref:hypothetical protein n=2 Tax=Parafrankia sp. EUN1f TaxID=102897 RepID=UPI0001C46300|nr:hypothetical protein [Parafrankia sp. EUN1f]EFC82198.1 hypothetical protein FrEUN1fDRAFT_4655 [Parafrankia sp. EUN1f]
MRSLTSVRPRGHLLPTAFLVAALALIGVLTVAQPGKAAAPTTIDNPSFETGNLTGWNVIEGQAFTNATVSSAAGWGWGCCFNPEGTYHLWGAATGGGDAPTGRMRSSTFTLAGTGEISFLLGGGNNLENLFVALHRVSDGAELMRATNTAFADSETLSRVVWDASAHLGQELYLEVVDTATGGWGHLNLDDVRTYTERSISQIVNPGFETGDLTGWTATGRAFSAAQVTNRTEWGWGCCFNPEGTYHLWGANNVSDNETGTLTSSSFTLGGTGEISFLIGGGNNLANLYVALHRVSDGAELMRATNTAFADSEAYSPVRWNAADYLGEELYFRIVDNAAGGWGHINVDAFDVADDVVGHEFDNAGFEAGSLQGWAVDGEAFSEATVSSAIETPDGEPFAAQGTYHLWGGALGDCLIGTLTSPRFVVGGGEEIRLLLGGTDDPEVYVAVESDADGQELARVGVGTSHETYEEVVLDLPGHSGKTVRLRLVDNSTTGHLNVDDVRNLTDGAVNSSFDGGSGTSAHDRGSVDNIAYVIDHAAGQRSTETSTRPCESSTGGAPQSTTL